MDFGQLAQRVKIRHLERLTPPPPPNMALHAENRARLVAALRAAPSPPPPRSFALFAGGAAELRHDTDHEPLFRQESFFHWAFGVREPDCLGAVCLNTGAATLFVPRLPPAYAVVMGRIRSNEEWRGVYAVERVEYVEDLARVLREGVGGSGALLTLHGRNTDSQSMSKPAAFPGIEAFTVDQAALFPAAVELRVIKTPAEQAQLRYVGAVSSEAHIAVMQAVCEGMIEYQLESLFSHWCYFYGGCRHNSYTCICASGINASVLHYGHAGEPNGRRLLAGDMCLFDMGGEYQCYGADITTSFPVSGKFTAPQRMVYEAVLEAVYAVEDAIKPGVSWLDMHTLSYRCILKHLIAAGLVVGELEAAMAVNIGAIFMPHGLGHFLGIDTHDVGGYMGGAVRPEKAGYARLRTTRTLAAGMYITVEPGCYFIDVLLDEALGDPARAPFLNAAAIAPFRGTGGVRIEDDVLVTATGCENFTHAPRTVADVEAACAGLISSIEQVKKHH